MPEIESIAPILSVIADDGDYVVRATGTAGAKLAQPILAAIQGARRITYIDDAGVKMFKASKDGHVAALPAAEPVADIQDEFIAQVEAEERQQPPRKRQIQDTAAPPSPELAEDMMAELARQEREAGELAKQTRFNAQELPKE